MTNAKEEFLKQITGKAKVICAQIWYGYEETKVYLNIGYTESQFENFLEKLNFNYDDGFGGQYLYGIIWYEDKTWSSRGEYDGSEWWEYNKVPAIPNECYGLTQ